MYLMYLCIIWLGILYYVDCRYKIHYHRRTRNIRVFIFEKDTNGLYLLFIQYILYIVYNHGKFEGLINV